MNPSPPPLHGSLDRTHSLSSWMVLALRSEWCLPSVRLLDAEAEKPVLPEHHFIGGMSEERIALPPPLEATLAMKMNTGPPPPRNAAVRSVGSTASSPSSGDLLLTERPGPLPQLWPRMAPFFLHAWHACLRHCG